ncbi:MAG: helix-turn-helix domain-containing protein [Rhodothermales bacterium]|nr:helix-turn-helix domain-containing protein [Rhodothermales bacterium]
MPDAPNAASSAHLAQDLQRIREARGFSLDALHEETKIPLTLLRQFEETGLADHPMFNRVYLRSLVRAYAELVDLPTEAVLDALDAALSGHYDGQLMALDRDEEPEPEEEGEQQQEAAAAAAASASATTQEEAAREEAEPEPEQPAEPPAAPTRAAPEEETSPPGAARRPEPVQEAAASGSDWDSVSPSPSAAQRQQPAARRAGRTAVDDDGSLMKWVAAGGVVIVLAGGIWLLMSLLGNGEESPAAVQPVAAVDTTAADTTAAPEPQRPQVTIGDTLNVVVVAQNGPVQGIRITRDEDLRRPYWIEEGQAKAFPALQRIVIEEQLSRIRLLLEGYPYPTDRRDDRGRIVITRETAQAFVDTLSGPPVDLQAELERVQKGPIADQ